MNDPKAAAAYHPQQPPGEPVSTPDYAAELAFATWLANQHLEDIDTVTISETLPDELWSEEAVERIENLMSCFTAEVNAQAEIAYAHGGKTR